MMSRKFRHWIYLSDEGKKLYGEIFPNGEIPVLSMIPAIGGIEGKPERLYLIYHEELSNEQIDQMLTLLSRKFGADKELIRHEMLQNRIPIREKFVSSSGTNHLGLFI
jgi:hypothetical protein